MLFYSPIYIFLFLPIVIIIYFLLNKFRYIILGKIWIVCASLFFYGYWNYAYLFLIITSMLFNYSFGRLLHRARKREKNTHRKFFLITGVVLNLGLISYYKYSDFFIENFNTVFAMDVPLLNLLLPLAISFFTFQQIAYLVDCYKTDTQEYSFLNYCLFVSFFPQLIAGPIVHHTEMMPQFAKLKNAYFNYINFAKGVFIFSMGLFKKVVIADTFAIWANAGFDSNLPLNFFDAWASSLSYTFQLYYDFSGYTDMAIGAALMFNIYLPLNFNSPYKALNIQDFWRRWHMTLSRWLKDYVYIPLGGNRNGSTRVYINLMLTFILGGLWHGAGWTFILWGFLHGLALVIFRLWSQLGIKLPVLFSWLITFLFVNTTWVFFRAEDLTSAVQMLQAMAGFNGFSIPITTTEETISSIYTLCYVIIFSLLAFLGKNSIQIAMNKRQE